MKEGFSVSIKIPVRFADCDMLGHVNHAKFFTYMEEVRVCYFQKMGLLFNSVMTEAGISGILAEATCTYKSPARLGEVLSVSVRIVEVKRTSFIMEYEIREDQTGRLVAVGKTVAVLFDYVGQKSVEIPAEMRALVEKIEGR